MPPVQQISGPSLLSGVTRTAIAERMRHLSRINQLQTCLQSISNQCDCGEQVPKVLL